MVKTKVVVQGPLKKGQRRRNLRIAVVSAKKKKSGKRGRSASLAANRSTSRPSVQLGTCAAQYAAALGNPFNGPLACIPLFPSIPSQRIRTWVRGSMSTGTAGYGSISANPFFVANTTASAGFTPVRFTDNTYAGAISAGFPVAAGSVVGVNKVYANSPYSAAQISATGIMFRVVAAGLRIFYTGTVLNKGGVLYGLQHPNHQSIEGYTPDNMMAFEEAAKTSNTNETKTFTVYYKPVDQDDLEFSSANGKAGNDDDPVTVNGGHYMGIAVVAPIGTPFVAQQFDFEYFSIIEFTGPNVPSKQPSDADPQGFSAVNTVTAGNPKALQPTSKSPGSTVSDILGSATQYLNSVADTGVQLGTAAMAGKRVYDVYNAMRGPSFGRSAY